MNKQEQNTDRSADSASTNTGTCQAITETMNQPGFDAEQLPGLWQQAIKHPARLRVNAWNDGIETMYARCETYPPCAKLAIILSGMPASAWPVTLRVTRQVNDLVRQATAAQILQALDCEQQHPEGWWKASDHVLMWATAEQLTGEVIEQITWHDWFRDFADDEKDTSVRHVSEHIQQRLLGGNNDAWVVFQGIVGQGTTIGETAELACAIAQKNRSS